MTTDLLDSSAAALDLLPIRTEAYQPTEIKNIIDNQKQSPEVVYKKSFY